MVLGRSECLPTAVPPATRYHKPLCHSTLPAHASMARTTSLLLLCVMLLLSVITGTNAQVRCAPTIPAARGFFVCTLLNTMQPSAGGWRQSALMS